MTSVGVAVVGIIDVDSVESNLSLFSALLLREVRTVSFTLCCMFVLWVSADILHAMTNRPGKVLVVLVVWWCRLQVVLPYPPSRSSVGGVGSKLPVKQSRARLWRAFQLPQANVSLVVPNLREVSSSTFLSRV